MSVSRRESVAERLSGSVLRARPEESVGQVLRRFAQEKPRCADLILVVGRDGRLEGCVAIAALLARDRTERLAAFVDKGHPRAGPRTDQERAASLALHGRVDALPVVDSDGRPLGVLPAQALLQVLRREHVEDLHRLSGIRRETAQARHAIEDPPLRSVRHRLPWLLAGFAGSCAAAAAVAAMEGTLRANVAVAFFIPSLVYLADAIGTQAEAVAVRGLSLTRAGLRPLLVSELRTGLLLGLMLAVLGFLLSWAWLGDLRLAAAVAASIAAAGTVANGLGLLLPWTLHALGLDPAFGAGPFSTVIQDLATILIYLAVLKALGL